MADTSQQNPARQTAEAVQTSGRTTSDTIRRGGQLAADATRRVGEAGAEAMDRSGRAGSESIRQGTQELAETQQQIVRNAAEQFEQLSRKVAQAVQGTSEDVHSLMVLPGAARGGLQDVQQGVSGLIEAAWAEPALGRCGIAGDEHHTAQRWHERLPRLDASIIRETNRGQSRRTGPSR